MCAGQEASLLAVLRVKAHAVCADRVARFYVDHFARLQRSALRQRRLKIGGGVAAVQPVREQCLLAGVVEAQQVGQAR